MLCGLIRDDLLEVLYDEASPSATARVQEHLAGCVTCREEMTALRGVRRDLAEWMLPSQTGLGRLPVAIPARPRAPYLAALAAGLVIAFGASLGLSGSEVRYSDGRLSFRLGRADGELRSLIAAQESRHRDEIRALTASIRTPERDDAALLEQVGEMIRESERRQSALLTASLTGLSARTEAQRRYDLARVSAGLSYLDGKNGEQVARTTELMGYVLQASQKR
jgi:hypothetical protein